jgi:two-component sensor histidine kinase
MLVVQTSLPPRPSSVPAARRIVRERLGHERALVETAELLTAELVSNAVRHAGTPLTVSVTNEAGGDVRLLVTDDSVDLPSRKDMSPERMHGYGLMLLDGLASEWGVTVTPGRGKTVWCRIRSDGVS